MAQKVSVTLEDDIDGSEAVETIVFALNGQSYEIDLSEKNAGKFRNALQPFVEAGRKQSAKRGTVLKRTAPVTGDRPDPSLVRAWALAQGLEVSARGRVPSEIVEKYQASH
ncbi:histone-like nucleoid-structuring protein Lsr2 [Streptacidiphilus sp. PAMC 29251]